MNPCHARRAFSRPRSRRKRVPAGWPGPLGHRRQRGHDSRARSGQARAPARRIRPLEPVRQKWMDSCPRCRRTRTPPARLPSLGPGGRGRSDGPPGSHAQQVLSTHVSCRRGHPSGHANGAQPSRRNCPLHVTAVPGSLARDIVSLETSHDTVPAGSLATIGKSLLRQSRHPLYVDIAMPARRSCLSRPALHGSANAADEEFVFILSGIRYISKPSYIINANDQHE